MERKGDGVTNEELSAAKIWLAPCRICGEAFLNSAGERFCNCTNDIDIPATRADLNEPPDMMTPTGRMDRLP